MIDKSKSPHNYENLQAASAAMSHVSPGCEANGAADDVALFHYFKNLAPPVDRLAKKRLETLVPALVTAYENGNSVKSLVGALKSKGISVSAVTLRTKICAYQSGRRNGGAPDPVETV